jgi:hypothetical protein
MLCLPCMTVKEFVEVELMKPMLGLLMRYFDYHVDSLAKALHRRFALT